MQGVVGAGGEKPPATRFGDLSVSLAVHPRFVCPNQALLVQLLPTVVVAHLDRCCYIDTLRSAFSTSFLIGDL